jgi:hypothetical protein
LTCGLVPAAAPSLDGIRNHFSKSISRQAIDKRFTKPAVLFLKSCLELILQRMFLFSNQQSLYPKPFRRLLLADSTQWQIHSALTRSFRGSGGSASTAACKLQTIIEPRSGKLLLLDYGKATLPDQGYSKKLPKILSAGDLLLFDLGYYSAKVFQSIHRRKAFFIIPIYHHATVRKQKDQTPCSIASLLSTLKGPFHDAQLFIGSDQLINLRLVAAKVSPEKANSRRRKLRQDYRRRRAGLPTTKRLQFCDWTVLITNIPSSQLIPTQILALYQTRWQIEIFFRDLKSLLKLDFCNTSNKERFLAQLHATLFLAALLFFISSQSNLAFPSKMLHEISFNKFLKRFAETASSFSQFIAKQTKSSFLNAALLLRKILRLSIKLHQPSRQTPLQILKNCGLS